MEFEYLKALATSIYGYFNRKYPSDVQLELWNDELGHIPEETRKYIFNEIIKHDTIPQNVPKVIKSIYQQWRKDNPSKVAFKYEDCEYCNMSGGLVFQIKGYDFMCRCGHCQNWRGSYGENMAAMYTVLQIEATGGLVVKTPYDSAFGGLKKRDIKPPLKNLTKSIDEECYGKTNKSGSRNSREKQA